MRYRISAVAAVLEQQGIPVYRPSAERMYHLGRAGHGKNKTNQIDALTLARCLMTYPQDTHPVLLAKAQTARLDQLIRQRDRIVDSKRRRKQRIQGLCEPINPMLTGAMGTLLFTEAGRAFLQNYLDPNRVQKLGQAKLCRFLQKRHRKRLLPDQAEAIMVACRHAAALYENIQDKPFDVETLQDEMNWELDLLSREEKRIKQLEEQIHTIYTQIDPHGLLISLPGIADILAAAILTCTGAAKRFPSLCKHRGFAGLYPTRKSTGDQTTTHGKISKQSHNRYKRTLYLAAENAYKWDVELCAFYHKRRQKGHTHTQAVCAVANAKLIPRIHRMLKAIHTPRVNGHEPPHYVYRDQAGHPISKTEARAIIVAKWGQVAYTS